MEACLRRVVAWRKDRTTDLSDRSDSSARDLNERVGNEGVRGEAPSRDARVQVDVLLRAEVLLVLLSRMLRSSDAFLLD